MTKRCSKCSIEKELSEFTKQSKNKDGLNYWCKSCMSSYYRENAERIKQKSQEWHSNNRERSRAIKKKWSDANPEKQASAIRAWQEKNAERFAATKKDWREANREVLRVHTINRRRKLAEGLLSPNIIDILLARQNGICAGCGEPLGIDYHIDHVHPIAKGGRNTDENVQLLHGRCNLVKAAKWPWEVVWPQKPQISDKTS